MPLPHAVRLALALAALALATQAPAADKSSARPNVIAVPSGPGSISGLGESFEPNLNTGSVRESVAIDLPPGTAGLTPTLGLAYDSGQGNGPLGLGWSLGLSTIQVQTEKGLPRYDGSDRFLLDGAELVEVSTGVYRQKNEGRFARARRVGEHWEVDAPDGKTLRYGLTADARVEDSGRIFSWALEEVVDLFGNRIAYSYAKDHGQPYLIGIDYNLRAGAADHRIVLDYEPRPDPLTDGRARFEIATAQRLRRISAFSGGALVRRWIFAYDVANGISLLSSVSVIGADDRSALPPLRFWYSTLATQPAPVSMTDVPDALPRPGAGDDELVDVDGDGFPDLLHAESGAHWYALNDGGARFGPRVDMPWSPSVALSTRGVEIGDFNGDGLPDLLARLGLTNPEWHTFPSAGRGRWEGDVVFTTSPPFGLDDPNVRMLDFDHDKLVDAVQSTVDGFHLWRNRGDGSWEGPFTAALPPDGSVVRFEDAKLKLADVNGDRLLDLVYVLDGSVTYWPSRGWGEFGPAVSIANAPAPGPLAEADLLLADMTGDGLADLLWVAPDHVDVWPLLPGDAFGERIRILGTPYRDPAATAIRLADMNGNGSADLVWSTPSAPAGEKLVYLDLVGDVRPNLLVAVENGLGKRLELRYGSSGVEYGRARAAGEPWGTRVPFPVQVLASSTLQDGLGNLHVTSYAYRDGWYAPETREFRGFARAMRTELGDESEATSVSIHDFDLGATLEALKGLPLAIEARTEAGVVLRRERTGYEAPVLVTGLDGTEVRHARRRWHEVDHVEGSASPVTTREELQHDEYGNVVVASEWGIVRGTDLRVGGDERITTTEYLNDPQSWLLGRAYHKTVTDAAGTRLSEARTYYDGPAFLGLAYGELGPRGLPTRTEAWIDGDRWAQTERVERDDYGNVVATLDAVGTRREVTLDEATHRFPVTERVLLDGGGALTFHAAYDPVLGTLTSYRDAGGAETRFLWDPLFHLTAIVRPGDSDAKPSVTFEYRYGDPVSRVVTRSRIEPGGEAVLEKQMLYDGLGRSLALVEAAEDGKTLVSGMRHLGLQGRVVREYEPFLADGFDPPAPATPFTSHAYDALGRRVASVLPDGSRAETRYAPFAVESWDAEDLDPASPHAATPKTDRLSALGVVEVEERLGAERVVTHFRRDALGRVVSLVDSAGRETTYAHDGLGRVVASVHPDAGSTTFVYDAAGRLLERIDARGARVVTAYDAIGRPTVERLVDGAGQDEEVVRYHYDAPSPLFPGEDATGDLAWVEDAGGEEHYRRDTRGRLVETVRKVDGKSYRIATALDGLDRVKAVTYPDDRTLEYRYGARGLLESVPGVISRIDHDARGRATRLEYASGTVSTARYDEMDRVAGLETVAGGRTVQSASYGYDRVGNLLQISDALRASGTLSAGRAYGYDDLYRLVSGTGADRTWSYAYHPDGRFASRSDLGVYAYGAAHQATDVAGKAYRFDQAGNVVERPGSVQTFDAKGRLKTITMDDGTEVRFRYDYTGARIVKSTDGPGGAHRTVYVDRLAEERDGALVDYVFAGDRRVAKLGGPRPEPVAAGTLTALPPILGLGAALSVLAALALSLARTTRRRFRPAVALATAFAFLSVTTAGCSTHGDASAGPEVLAAVYYHGDHLGGVAVQTDEQGAVVAETAFDPFGGELASSTEPYAFTGKERDPETGLYDFGARVYDPALGRFLSPDPAVLADPELAVGDPQLLDVYAYARNTPTGYVDPDGRLPHILVGALIGAAIGGGVYLVKAAVTGEFSGRGLGASLAGGAVSGAVAAATGGASLVVQGMSAGVAGGLTQRAIETRSLSKTVDPVSIGTDAVLGGAMGPAAKLAGKAIGAVATKVAPVVKAGLARAGQGLKAGAQAVERQARAVVARANVAFRSFATEEGKAVFYSGPGQWKVAETYARMMGKQTIADTPGGAWLNAFQRNPSELPDWVWKAASKKFADGARGKVTSLVEGARPDRVYEQVELPALLKNPAVTLIQEVGRKAN
ncbi:toxin TcdB middle/N-terminal domain-containing protein [Anaeromyxobacter terrae]|uniref:toxin TcdB middle/N-terminal domain-containing protein n=1 Tax=Anaeromyxobacter terrae TaxID=2925406 RepID=UPI001F5A28E7|nr:toxin TcdB middle/N-terminal domain-containing protein [Anaeromyxobacter sp. SG22]